MVMHRFCNPEKKFRVFHWEPRFRNASSPNIVKDNFDLLYTAYKKYGNFRLAFIGVGIAYNNNVYGRFRKMIEEYEV